MSARAWIHVIPEAEATGELQALYAQEIDAEKQGTDNIMAVHSLNPPTLRAHADLYHTVMPMVFPSRAGTYRFPAVMTRPLQKCCAVAGISKHLTSHCLRKTTNNLVRQTSGDVVARQIVGHTTKDMTLLYSTVDAAERGRAHDAAFGDAFGVLVDGEVGRNDGTTTRPTEKQAGDET